MNDIERFEAAFKSDIYTISIQFNADRKMFKKNTTAALEKVGIKNKTQNGVHVILNDTECLYVGSGIVLDRLIAHNNSAFGNGPAGEGPQYHQQLSRFNDGQNLIIKIILYENNENKDEEIVLKHFMKCLYQPQLWNE